MINRIYFIQNGGCIFINKSFKKDPQKNVNDDILISGFLTAVSQFAETALGDKLKVIFLQNQKIFFKFFDNFFIVLISELDDDLTYLKNVTDDLSQNFIEKYDLNKFDRSTDFYSDFLPTIDDIIEKFKTNKDKILEDFNETLKVEIKKLSTILKRGEVW